MQSLSKTRRWIRWRTVLMSLALLFSLLPFSFSGDDEGIEWLWAGHPFAVAGMVLLALVFWTAYGAVWYRLRVTQV